MVDSVMNSKVWLLMESISFFLFMVLYQLCTSYDLRYPGIDLLFFLYLIKVIATRVVPNVSHRDCQIRKKKWRINFSLQLYVRIKKSKNEEERKKTWEEEPRKKHVWMLIRLMKLVVMNSRIYEAWFLYVAGSSIASANTREVVEPISRPDYINYEPALWNGRDAALISASFINQASIIARVIARWP